MTSAPGAYCTATNGGALSVRTDGEIENTSSAAVTALCPVERSTTSTAVSGDISVVDRNSTADVCCHLVSKNPTGARIDGTAVCSTGKSTTPQSLTLPQITDSFTFSHFMVECTVPAVSGGFASRIQVYRTTQ